MNSQFLLNQTHSYILDVTFLMLLFIEIFVILLLPKFYYSQILYQYCELFTSHWFYFTISGLSMSSHFLFIYPCQYMLLGRQEWIYSTVQNQFSKQKQKTEVCYTLFSIIPYTLYIYS